MKPASTALKNALKNDVALHAVPKVIVDWNLNRYHNTRTDNTPDEQQAGYDIELFPVESIAEPLRPHKGINKARIGTGTTQSGDLRSRPIQEGRFYACSPDDIYKYWTSPLPAVDGVMPLFNETNFPSSEYEGLVGRDNLTSARPYVEYGTGEGDSFVVSTVGTNKIVIKLENTWATPADFDIVLTRNASTLVIPNNELTPGWEGPGEIILRWNGSTWSDTNDIAVDADGLPLTDQIKRVRLTVRTLKGGYKYSAPGVTPQKTTFFDPNTRQEVETNGATAFLDVIEISARLEADLSPWVINMSDTFEMSEHSHLYPIGTLTSNEGSLTLSNIYTKNGTQYTGLFQDSNRDTPWWQYIEENAEVTGSYIYYDADGNVIDEVQQFKMYADDWEGQADETVTVPMKDYTKFFNSITPRPALWEGLTGNDIIQRVLDSVGFTDYYIGYSDLVTDAEIPMFFMSEDQSLFEVLDELAKATQTAIYVDENGILQVLTREDALDPDATPVWTLQSFNDETQLSNIESVEQQSSFEPNEFKVNYQTLKWPSDNKGFPKMQKVWEPEGTTVLRGNPLARNLEVGDTHMWMNSKDAALWPFRGLVNIEGEFIRYDGKVYVYYTGPSGGIRNSELVRSQAQVNKIRRHKVTKGHAHRSYFNGAFRITERGVWNSEPRAHRLNAAGYSVRSLVNKVRRTTNVLGMYHRGTTSKMELNTTVKFKNHNDYLLVTRGNPEDFPFFHYGTKMRFVRSAGKYHQSGGMVIYNQDASEDGYYIEFVPDRLILKRTKRRECLVVFARKNGKNIQIARAPLPLIENKDYEIDVSLTGSNHFLEVWVDGKKMVSKNIPTAAKLPPSGRFGLYARGRTKMRAEYLYAVRREIESPPDDFSFLDKVQRAYTGGQWDREWVYSWRNYRRKVRRRWVKDQRRFNRQFFDEFGPIVHEIREFDVEFEPTPVLHSKLYMSNDWSTIPVEYVGTPFGAKFIIANTSRQNAVINGEDKASFSGVGASVNQVLAIFGRVLVEGTKDSVTVRNERQIRMRGKNEAELDSRWIQSIGAAQELADWVGTHWTHGNDIMSVTAFGNPLLTIGDVVRLEYPERNISGEYFVVSVSNEFDAGISTSLTLRRRRI